MSMSGSMINLLTNYTAVGQIQYHTYLKTTGIYTKYKFEKHETTFWWHVSAWLTPFSVYLGSSIYILLNMLLNCCQELSESEGNAYCIIAFLLTIVCIYNKGRTEGNGCWLRLRFGQKLLVNKTRFLKWAVRKVVVDCLVHFCLKLADG